MRKYLVILFLLFPLLLNATDYYVKTGGSDVANGDITHPWATITKVNSYFSSLAAGDRVLFNRGDTFYGTITPNKSGSAGSLITIGAYGTGANPIITGFTTLTGWTSEGGSLYSEVITSESQTNMVTVNGINTAIGRYPDATYLTYESHVADVSITDNGIGDAVNWTGAELVINKDLYTTDQGLITNHTSDVFTYTDLGSGRTGGFSSGTYFIQNDLRCVTATNEWYHDYASTGKFYIYGNPTAKTVKVATLNYLFFNNGYSYIIVENLTFDGSILDALYFSSGAANCTLQDCTITFSGEVSAKMLGGYSTLNNNQISNSGGGGIWSGGTYATITNNTLTNIGLIEGQYTEGSHSFGILLCANSLAQYNNLYNIGYHGIWIFGVDGITVKNNYVIRFCLLLTDGGGIYSGMHATSTDVLIDGNIVFSGGLGPYSLKSMGIYMDHNSSGVTIQNNTVAHCPIGILIAHSHWITLTNNTVFDNVYGVFFANYFDDKLLYGNTLNDNILFSTISTIEPGYPYEYSLYCYSYTNDIPNFFVGGGNYYAKPLEENTTFLIWTSALGGYTYMNLPQWQAYSGLDANSYKSITTLTDSSSIDFYYNPSKINKTVSLSNPMIDVKGTKYATSIVLLPYETVVLMPDPVPSAITERLLIHNGKVLTHGGKYIVVPPPPPPPDGRPSGLTVTTLGEASLKLDWTNGSTNEDNLVIERSTDNITWSSIAYPVAGSTTYTNNTGLVHGTLYYYHVRAKKGTLYSTYSNIASATTYGYFTTTWQTENAGSATKTIEVPTTGAGYDCWVDWGDGSAEENFTGTAPSISHVYATTGVKTVKIRGAFPRIYFNNGGDKLKLLTIENWGIGVWTSMQLAFYGCTNLTGNYTDIPNTSSVTDMSNMFNGCIVFNSATAFNTANATTMNGMFYQCQAFNQSLTSFNTAKVTDMRYMFYQCLVFNQSVAGFNTANVTRMDQMFDNCSVFKQSLATFNIVKVTNFTNFARYCDINETGTATNYDATLVSWEAQSVHNTITISFGTSKYTAGGTAAAARAHLVLATGSGGHGWTITDGGAL